APRSSALLARPDPMNMNKEIAMHLHLLSPTRILDALVDRLQLLDRLERSVLAGRILDVIGDRFDLIGTCPLLAADWATPGELDTFLYDREYRDHVWRPFSATEATVQLLANRKWRAELDALV